MNRECRSCARIALDAEIMIGYSQTGFVRARVREIGLGGLYVETAASLALDRPVEIIFRAPANGISRTHRWRATVRHIAADGVGLKYEPFVLTELPALLRLLQAAERQALERAEERTGLRFDGGMGKVSTVPGPSTGLRQDRRTPGREP